MAHAPTYPQLQRLNPTALALTLQFKYNLYLNVGTPLESKIMKDMSPDCPPHLSFLQANVEFGYALCDIITELALLVAQTELPDTVSAYLIDK